MEMRAFLILAAVVVFFAGGAAATNLEITPVDDFEPSGESGGPFTPSSKDYQLTNIGPNPLYWNVTKTAGWLSLGPQAGGQLPPYQSTIVAVSLTSGANSLPAGVYIDTLTFTDPIDNVEQTRGVTLTIALPAGIRLDPNSFDVNTVEGTTLTEALTIGNDGLDDLSFTILSRTVGSSEQSAQTFNSTSAQAFDNASLARQARRGLTAAKVTKRDSSVPRGLDFTKPGNVPYKPGELIVHFAPKANGIRRNKQEKKQILNSFSAATIKRNFKLVPGLSVVKLPPGMTVEKALHVFNKANGILYAQPNYQVKICSTIPDDPRFDELWGMTRINAPEAWDISIGSSQIIIAVIDTGVDYTHPDLVANMWVNEAEFNGTQGFDDDGNGFVDDIYGYDFCNDDGNPMDDHYHGTHCAGTIGAVGNNSQGVAGVCWNVRIMAIKFLDSGGGGWTSDAIESVEYSILMGANLSSNSWGGVDYNQGLKDAIDAAGAAGMLFVAAAGNPYDSENPNNDESPRYPASLVCDSIIAVMATDHSDVRSIWPSTGNSSAYGPTSVDLGAPGTNILSCQPGNNYQYLNGTSMATPHVAGACAILWSINPMLSNIEVKDIILQTVDKTLPGLCASEGRLNLYNAILQTGAPWLDIEPGEGTIATGDSNEISITFNAMTMEPGTYEAEILVLSNDPYCPTLVIPATMTVNADALVVTPAEGFDSNGTEGGPFEPQCMTYTLTNNGIEHVDWTAAWTENWLSVTPYEETLDPNESIEVDVCIDPNANLLGPNIYTDTVTFQNLNSTSIKPRSVTLSVEPPDRFTESLDSGSDLEFLSLTFIPDGSIAYYEACREKISEFPIDPNGGTYVSLGDDDFAEVILNDGVEILFHGQWYDRFYIGSNGYITFGQGHTEYMASLEEHFSMPRISALFTDLTPATSQSISYKQLDNRIVVTFQDVPLYGDKSAISSFQVEMFFADGAICISWLDIAATEAVAGLSEGEALPAFFIESDLSGYPPCWPLGDFDRDYFVNFVDFAVLAMHWLDEDCSIPFWCGRTDLDFSSMVDIVDVGIFAENWLAKEDWWLQPLSHWKFEEGEGDTAYDSAGNNHGTIYGAQWTTGQIDGALSFDGDGDYVDCGSDSSLNITDEMTIIAWINVDRIDERQVIVAKTENVNTTWLVEKFLDGKLNFYLNAGGSGTNLYSNYIIDTDVWYHVAFVYNGAYKTIYINGQFDTNEADSGSIPINDQPVRIGSWSGSPVRYFDGTIDDVRIYDRALSAEEIWQLYQQGL